MRGRAATCSTAAETMSGSQAGAGDEEVEVAAGARVRGGGAGGSDGFDAGNARM